MANEPSMEDILSSIKRIIADGSDRPASTKGTKRRTAARGETPETPEDAPQADDAVMEGAVMEGTVAEEAQARDPSVLELTDIVEDQDPTRPAVQPVEEFAPMEDNQTAPSAPANRILSDTSAEAARQSLIHLSSLLVRPEDGQSNTLEGLVREMLRPMLKEWLEAKLPELVETMVKKEIDRIVGRLG